MINIHLEKRYGGSFFELSKFYFDPKHHMITWESDLVRLFSVFSSMAFIIMIICFLFMLVC